MFQVGVVSNMVSSYLAVPLMLPHGQGFIVHTLAPVQYEHPVGRAALSYDLRAIDRMAHGMAEELRPYNIAVVALGIGWLRTGYLLDESKTDDLNAYKFGDLWQSQSTQYVGWAVVALATDPDLMQKARQLHRTADLGREYGFTDIDGRHPGEPG
jgi:NAD(P)-dependent dehydrogenase (short-subunit alcohol dehydrogenase family)